MYRSPQQAQADRRQGVILLVVVSMLTLFAIVGLSFVLYADASARTALICREGEQLAGRTDMSTEFLCDLFLGQLVYDVPDDATGVYSAIRGHSLARTLYGWNDDDPTGNNLPYNGTGRLYLTPSYPPGFSDDDRRLINYTYFPGDNFLRDPERYGVSGAVPAPTSIRNNLNTARLPFTGGFNPPYTYPDLNNLFLAAVKADGTVLTPSFHRHWLFNPKSTSNPTGALNDLANPNWTNAIGKYLTLRPRPIDQGPNSRFPYPEDATGDVKNLVGAPGGNDSIWIDLGAPIMVAPDGKKFKPLFAPLIIDLDNRVNLNVHGNVRGVLAGSIPTHASNQGWGPWEVSLRHVLDVDRANDNAGTQGRREWLNLFFGTPVPVPTGTPAVAPPTSLVAPSGYAQAGRYGGTPWSTTAPVPSDPGNRFNGTAIVQDSADAWWPLGAPGAPARWAWSPRPHFYSQIDYDGIQAGGSPAATYIDPATGTVRPWGWFSSTAAPQSPAGYDNAIDPLSGIVVTDEIKNHPLLYSFFQPHYDDRVFSVSNMEALLRYGDTGSSALRAPLLSICPRNFDPADSLNAGQTPNPAVRRMNLVTTHSFDVCRPGLSPWIYDRTPNPTDPGYTYTAAASTELPVSVATPAPFPSLTNRGPTNTVPANSDFKVPGVGAADPRVDWRAVDAALGRMDLNRFLPPYPHQGQGTTPTTYKASPLCLATDRFDTAPALQAQANAALAARQSLANDIYQRLLKVTGAPPLAGTDNDLMPRRWLAQLAVNIVDYLDEDDISTAFNFEPTLIASVDMTNPELFQAWVFGTELPRVVLNEVLAEYAPPTATPAGSMGGATNVRFYVELYNPLPNSLPAAFSQDTTPVPLYMPAGMSPYATYQVVIGSHAGTSTSGLVQRASTSGPVCNDNVLGTPSNALYSSSSADFAGAVTTVSGATGGAAPMPAPGTNVPPGSYFLIAPQPASPNQIDITNQINGTTSPPSTPVLQVPGTGMQVPGTYTPGAQPTVTPDADTTTGYVVFLRRLANPNLPYNNTPGASFNPYITVDYMEKIPAYRVNVAGDPAFSSRGKRQPYAGYRYHDPMTPTNPYNVPPATDWVVNQVGGGTILHTFGAANNPSVPPASWNWLVHLDRQLISPVEILHVSGYKPHLLTHQFISSPPTGTTLYTHRVNWFDQTNRLYRIFEFLECGNRARGVAFGGRVPGKININTIWDVETFRALCDPQTSNSFVGAPGTETATVDAIFNNVLAARMPGDATPVPGDPTAPPIPAGSLSSKDRPFRGLAAGVHPPGVGDAVHPNGSGIDDTFFRALPSSTARLFDVPDPPMGSPALHPYQKTELMTKLFNNITTRSNVFAVWVTVGFFEVVDDTKRPVWLGAEMGRAENKQIRHRFFAIVDRSNLTYLDQPVSTLMAPITAAPGPQAVTMPLSGMYMSGPPSSGVHWEISPGMKLIIGKGTANEETVTVQSVDSPTAPQPNIVAIFTKSHAPGETVTAPNNIGPPPVFLTSPSSVEANQLGAMPAATPYIVFPDAQLDASAGPGREKIVGTYDGIPWTIQAGSSLIVDANLPPGGSPPATAPEVVTIPANGISADPVTGWPRFTATFSRLHNGPVTITFNNTALGNPGPQPMFKARAFPWVVRHFTIIQ